MIVFVNPNDKTVTVCDTTIKVYSWSEFKAISAKISGKEVVYVVDAMETTGDEVLELLYSSMSDDDKANQKETSSNSYLHYTQKGRFLVNFEKQEYVFKGITDIKPLSSLPPGFLENCLVIVEGLKNGTFAIIDETEKQQIIETYGLPLFSPKKSSILVDSGISAEKAASASGKSDGFIEIDIGGSSGNFKKK
mgnify:CR=1 FL=1